MSLTVIGLDQASRYFGQLNAEMTKAAVKGLRKAAMRLQQVIVTEIIPSRSPQPVDRGVYRVGWKTESLPDGAVVFNDEPHAVFIEHGVRAENVKIGMVMINALAEWAMRKGIAEDEDEAKSIAWAIAKTMQQRGIFNRYEGGTGLHIMGEAVEDHAPGIIATEVARELDKL